MLVLSRRMNETIRIGKGITIKVLSINRGQVRIGIEAPSDMAVHRGEIFDIIISEGRDPEAHLRQHGNR